MYSYPPPEGPVVGVFHMLVAVVILAIFCGAVVLLSVVGHAAVSLFF